MRNQIYFSQPTRQVVAAKKSFIHTENMHFLLDKNYKMIILHLYLQFEDMIY